jgi:hypothetical protein
MRYDNAEAFRGDLERRLENRAEGDKWRLVVAQRDVAFDRLLARMVAVVPGQWSLAGERALVMRFPERPRNSWNLDIEWPNETYGALDDVPSLVMAHDAGDFFEVGMRQAGGGVTGRESWQRFDVEVSLAGRPFSTISLTLRLYYAPLPTELLLGEDTLGFADVPCVTVATMLLEIQAAEMLRSYISECASGFNPADLDGIRDLALVAAQSGLDADILGAVLRVVFARAGSELPQRMPDPFEGWSEPMRQMAVKAGQPVDFLPGYDGVVALFDPLLSGEVVEGTWDAARQSWQAPGSDDEGFVPPI